MKVTISTHNGSAARREHNIRNEFVVKKQEHIKPDGIHEIWKDEPFREAYHRIFDKSVKEYNDRQTREDRKIKNYYSKIEQDEKKHTVYEMIIGIYGKDENGNPVCDPDTGKQIMRRFYEDWEKRNPSLELIGAYYHADEDGEPHVHLDYIPVAHGYKNGMETQNGLVKAFEQMGIKKRGKETAQIQWEARENNYLESLCNDRGLEVDHPELDGAKHVHTETYKAQKELESLKEAVDRKSTDIAYLDIEQEYQEKCLQKKEEEIEQKRSEIAQIAEKQEKADRTLADSRKAVETENRSLEQKRKELAHVSSEVEDLHGKKSSLLREAETIEKSIRQARAEELEALRKAEDAKTDGNVFQEAANALRRLERAKTINVSVQKETPEKDGIFGHTRATVTIFKDDLNLLMQRDRDVSRAEGMYRNIVDAEEMMGLYARTIHKNRMDAHEISIESRVIVAEEKVKAKDRELEAERNKYREAQKEISGLKSQIEELKQKLQEVLNVITYFPRKWKEMIERSFNARKMEKMYREHDCHTISSFSSAVYYNWDGQEMSTRKFLEAYEDECRAHDLKPNREMAEHLENIYERRYEGPVR